LALTTLIVCLSLSASAERRQAEGQKVGQRNRIVPVYAFNKDGTPATGLTAGDLEVLRDGSQVEDFTLTKGGSSKRIIFLVFDSASEPYSLLVKSKKIAESVLSRTGTQARFVVMTIDPYFALQTIGLPTENREEASQAIARLVSAKKTDYIQSKAAEGTTIHDAYPAWADSAKFAPQELKTRKGLDRQKDRQLSRVIISSLTTLNAILARFPESTKVVHLYSCGIPTSATEDQTKIQYDAGETVELASPDSWTYDRVKTIGQAFKKTGALLFLINSAGTRVGEESPESGENSLKMIAGESGGRYLEGTDRDIARVLEAAEQGYYEISLSVPQDFAGPETRIDIHPKDPKIDIYSATSLSRGRRFREMSPQEREGLIVSLLSGGLVGDVDLKISGVPVEVKPVGEDAILIAQLPPELAQTQWDIYKVWKNPTNGQVQVEKEHVLTESSHLEFAMAIKKDYIPSAALVQSKTGTVLVCQVRAEAK
jgi:hypothetical protein